MAEHRSATRPRATWSSVVCILGERRSTGTVRRGRSGPARHPGSRAPGDSQPGNGGIPLRVSVPWSGRAGGPRLSRASMGGGA